MHYPDYILLGVAVVICTGQGCRPLNQAGGAITAWVFQSVNVNAPAGPGVAATLRVPDDPARNGEALALQDGRQRGVPQAPMHIAGCRRQMMFHGVS